MKTPHFLRILLAAAAVLAAATLASAQLLPECYHTRAEVDSFLVQLEAVDTQNLVHIDTIGWSRGDMLGVNYPLVAVRISDNADTFEDEPVVLLIAHIHAEEVIGLELTLNYMWDLVTNYFPNRVVINNTQIVVIPTMNPDGLEVISRGLDSYWRKNGYVPAEVPGGDCFIVPGAGDDSCGVDLNRNFELNWVYGDTLWYPAREEPFDYFRGPSPFSEPECWSVANHAAQIKPVVSAVFHSSRQGGNAERGIAAWQWGTDPGPYRVSPDCTAIGWINYRYCGLFTQASAGRYHTAWGSQRNGNLQDWFYRELGCIQINTELGPPILIQPPCDTLPDILQADMIPLSWLVRRAINYRLNTSEQGLTPLNIYTVDAVSGLPIAAEWRNLTTWNPIVGPWFTNEQHGRATTLPMPGTHQILARKEGYVNDTVSAVVFPNANAVSVELRLQPLPWYTFSARLRDENGAPVPGTIYIGGEYPKELYLPDGDLSISLPAGDYSVVAAADDLGRLVLWRNLHLAADQAEWFQLPATNQSFLEYFDDGLDGWSFGGTGTPWRLGADTSAVSRGTTLTTEGPGHLPNYAPNLDAWAKYDAPIMLGDGNCSVLSFWRRGRLDYPHDSLLVEVSPDGQTWITAAGFSDAELFLWTRSFVNLTQWAGQEINLRFRFKTDPALGDVGIHIDDISIITGIDTSSPERPDGPAYDYRITSSYPNPFNPSTTIAYDVAAPGNVRFVIYNTLGEEVRRFDTHAMAAGPHRLTWDGTAAGGASVGTGLYFIQMQAAGKVSTHKLLLIR